jgi:hypothetical protein
MKATITDHNINLEGSKYFVGTASAVYFGAYGRKETPIGPGKLNRLDVEGWIPAPKLAEVKLTVTPLTVEFADAKGINLFAAIKVPGLASGKVGLTVQDLSAGRVKLIKISPKGEGELREQLNASPKVSQNLIDFGGKARVVEDVLIAVEAKLFDRFSADLTSNGAVIVEGLLVQAERSASWDTTRVVEVGPGTCIGYSLAEPKWDAHQDKNKTRVVDLRTDQQGP